MYVPYINQSTPLIYPIKELGQAIVWPPKTVLQPVPKLENVVTLKPEDVQYQGLSKKQSICSAEVCSLSSRKFATTSYEREESSRPRSPIPDKQVAMSTVCAMTKKLMTEEKSAVVGETHFVETTTTEFIRERSVSPALKLLDVSTKPHEIRSLLPPASAIRPMSPQQVVVFPPEIPPELSLVRSRPVTPELPPTPAREIIEKAIEEEEKRKAVEEERKVEEVKQEETKQLFTKSQVEEIVKEELNKILSQKEQPKPKPKVVTIADLPPPILPSGPLADALSTAADDPFTPVPPPKAIMLPDPPKPSPFADQRIDLPEETQPYYPPPPPPPETEYKSERVTRALRETLCRSPMTEALTVASDRPYSPLQTPMTFQPIINETASSRSKKTVSMLSALTVAPEVPFTLPGMTPIPFREEKIKPTLKTPVTGGNGAFRPVVSSTNSVVSKPKPSEDGEQIATGRLTPKYFPTHIYIPQVKKEDIRLVNGQGARPSSGLHSPTLLPPYQQHIGETKKATPISPAPEEPKCNLTTVTPGQTKVPFTKTSQVRSGKAFFEKVAIEEKAQEILRVKKTTSQRAQSPSLLPYYQENIGEIPVRNKSISPVPHLIKAPVLNPPPSSRSTPPPTKKCGVIVSPQPSAPKININKSKQTFKPETRQSTFHREVHRTVEMRKIDERSSSPGSWKTKVRTVQNLSPIEVRLPSPCSSRATPKPVNMTSSVTSANEVVKPFPTMSTPKNNHAPLTTTLSNKKPQTTPNTSSSLSRVGGSSSGPTAGGGGRGGSVAGSTAPRRGRGVLNHVAPSGRIPVCGQCNSQIRGPFITALGKIWCPEHFLCVNGKCKRPLQDIGFVEEADGLYCEFCFEQYLAPDCTKCNKKIKGDCLNAIGKQFHPECFCCAYCGKLFGNSPFFLEDALPYCEADWNELFTTKCFSCGFPIEAGDRWVEALNNNYHSQCFNCSMCKKNLEGQSFFAKGGRPFCKAHAR